VYVISNVKFAQTAEYTTYVDIWILVEKIEDEEIYKKILQDQISSMFYLR